MEPKSQNLDPTGPGIALTFLYYFSMTTGIIVVTGSRFLDLTYTSPQLYQYGIGLGSAVGLLGVFINRNLIMDIAFEDRVSFQKQLDQALATMGFTQDSQKNRSTLTRQEFDLIYQRSGVRGWLAGRVYVVLSPGMAKISGRASNIRRLRPQLSLDRDQPLSTKLE
ncbi:MAG: hypothetical protein HC934_09885 [Acaryochloridaceae cyanobacterium SU_2_1]|nr:hypothetical protein [Acaryochloridaceae cyanobacterium SU_2_1]